MNELTKQFKLHFKKSSRAKLKLLLQGPLVALVGWNWPICDPSYKTLRKMLASRDAICHAAFTD